ncbi:MAG TPA: cell envelope protein, partial [Mycobacterium sp.]|nr:cell envelope protein [Mycobacterium sp.]
MIRRIGVVIAVLVVLAACSGKKADEADKSPAPPSPAAVTPEAARAIAKEAYIYGFPMVDSYRVQYSYFVNNQDP